MGSPVARSMWLSRLTRQRTRTRGLWMAGGRVVRRSEPARACTAIATERLLASVDRGSCSCCGEDSWTDRPSRAGHAPPEDRLAEFPTAASGHRPARIMDLNALSEEMLSPARVTEGMCGSSAGSTRATERVVCVRSGHRRILLSAVRAADPWSARRHPQPPSSAVDEPGWRLRRPHGH
jgi:hypothetical protein